MRDEAVVKSPRTWSLTGAHSARLPSKAYRRAIGILQSRGKANTAGSRISDSSIQISANQSRRTPWNGWERGCAALPGAEIARCRPPTWLKQRAPLMPKSCKSWPSPVRRLQFAQYRCVGNSHFWFLNNKRNPRSFCATFLWLLTSIKELFPRVIR